MIRVISRLFSICGPPRVREIRFKKLEVNSCRLRKATSKISFNREIGPAHKL
jgi:hypothetical protein